MFTRDECQLLMLALSTLRQHPATIHALRIALAAAMTDKVKALQKIDEVEKEWEENEPERYALDRAAANLQMSILQILNE